MLLFAVAFVRPFTCEGLEYSINGNSVTISGTGSVGSKCLDGYDAKNVVIKEGVTGINDRAFYELKSISTVTIPKTVNTIGLDVFGLENGLTSIIVDSSSEYYGIDSHGFLFDKRTMTIVRMPPGKITLVESSGYKAIGENAFAYCMVLTSVKFTGLETVGKGSFRSCYALLSVDLGDDVTSIGDYAFSYCYTTTSFNIPKSCISIGSYAFSFCALLIDITSSDSLKTIGTGAFLHCGDIKKFPLSSSIESLSDSVFEGCAALTEIDVTNIKVFGNKTFFGCRKLAVTIPATATSIGSMCFFGTATTDIKIPDSVREVGQLAFGSCMSATSVSFGSSMTKIPVSMMASCHMLTQINWSTSITEIGNYAFELCTSLKNLVIPDTVLSIGAYSFGRCLKVTELKLGKGVVSIGDHAFWQCESLTAAEIPATAKSVGIGVFAEIPKMIGVLVRAGNTEFYTHGEILFMANKTLHTCPGGKTGVITIPDDTKAILRDAFAGANKITSIVFPASIEYIGYGIAQGTTGLESLVFAGTPSVIETRAFTSIGKIKRIDFSGNSVGNLCKGFDDGFLARNGVNVYVSAGSSISNFCGIETCKE